MNRRKREEKRGEKKKEEKKGLRTENKGCEKERR